MSQSVSGFPKPSGLGDQRQSIHPASDPSAPGDAGSHIPQNADAPGAALLVDLQGGIPSHQDGCSRRPGVEQPAGGPLQRLLQPLQVAAGADSLFQAQAQGHRLFAGQCLQGRLQLAFRAGRGFGVLVPKGDDGGQAPLAELFQLGLVDRVEAPAYQQHRFLGFRAGQVCSGGRAPPDQGKKPGPVRPIPPTRRLRPDGDPPGSAAPGRPRIRYRTRAPDGLCGRRSGCAFR